LHRSRRCRSIITGDAAARTSPLTHAGTESVLLPREVPVPFSPKHGNPSKASETIISTLAAVETATQKTINGRKDQSKCCRTQDVFSAIGFTSTSEQSNLSPLT
jgi:hypothetical protein